jgi:hypothetical protein
MLAEIFMMRAEGLPRDTKEKLRVSSSPFIPPDRVIQFKFKGILWLLGISACPAP